MLQVSSSGASVSCKVIRAALLVAQGAGLDIPALLLRYGVTPDQVADPDTRFPHDLWLGLWRDVDASGQGAFGLRAAKALPPNHFDVIDYVMAAQSDLREGLGRFERYFAIVSTGVKHTLVEEGQNARLERRYAPGAHTSIGHPAEFAFACVLLRTRKMTGTELRPLEVRFAHARPTDDREARELFDCPLHFDAPFSSMLFDRASLDLPMSRPEPQLAIILERHGDALLASLPAPASDDIRSRAKEAIIEGLKLCRTSVPEIAKRLGMSERTLQRRLGDLGTSQAKLLDEARSELALRYLSEPSFSIPEVAFLLGFADVSTFHRAFRRWTNRTPAEHRREATEDARSRSSSPS